MECAPLCKLEWVVEGKVVTGEEEQFTFHVEELEEDVEQFTSTFTTLTIQPEGPEHDQMSVTCRLACLLEILFFILLLVFCRVKSYGNDLKIDLSSSSSINIQCETTLKKLFDFELFLISIKFVLIQIHLVRLNSHWRMRLSKARMFK